MNDTAWLGHPRVHRGPDSATSLDVPTLQECHLDFKRILRAVKIGSTTKLRPTPRILEAM